MKSSEKGIPRASIRPVVWFAWCLLAILVSLAGTVGMVILLRGWLVSAGQPVENLGVVGDIFGAGNALFSGMAFSGLIVVLVYEMRERKTDLSHRLESRRPVLSVRFDDDGARLTKTQATVTRAVVDEHHGVDLRLDFTVAIESLADVALHPSVTLVLSVQGNEYWRQDEEVGLPMVTDGHRSVEFVAQVGGKKGRQLLEAMRSSPGIRLRMALSYRSVAEVQWQTVVEADLRVALGDDVSAGKVLVDEGFVDKRRNGALAPVLKTDIAPDASSWDHGRVA